jgi:hypothetical protein
LSYGYGRSAIGRNLGRTKSASWLKAIATGSFLIAVGLLVMPHQVPLNELLSQFGTSKQTTIALVLIGLGIVLAISGALLGRLKTQNT